MRGDVGAFAFLAGVQTSRPRRRGGSPRHLFVGVCLVSVAGSVVFSLDAAAVAPTPVMLIAARRGGVADELLLFA